jgi:hypothetical protein
MGYKVTKDVQDYYQELRKSANYLINDALANQDTKYELFFTTGVIDTVFMLGIITENERCNYRTLADNKAKYNEAKKNGK